MESMQNRTGKETLRTVLRVCGIAGMVTALLIYARTADEVTRQLCGAAALVSALITIRQFMYNPIKPTNNHEHN